MIRVFIIDDSAVVRKLLTRVLAADPDLEVVGSAPDPFVGRDALVRLDADVLLLDIEMPRMDGLTFLTKLMAHRPMTVLVVSSLATEGSALAAEAIRAGAADVIAKPHGAYTLGDLGAELCARIKTAHRRRLPVALPLPLPHRAPPPSRSAAPLVGARGSHQIIAIGASTGGTKALADVIVELAGDLPAILVTQHMPEGFTRSFAERLNQISKLDVKEAEDGDAVAPGRMLVAPGGRHLVLRRSGALYRAGVIDGPPVNRHRPSVDVLFDSVAQHAGKNALGILLTGMGADGAAGLRRIREAGGVTIAQDERSSLVFGMPQAAIELDAADHVLALDQVPRAMGKFASGDLLGTKEPCERSSQTMR